MKPPVKQIILLLCLLIFIALFGKPVLAAEEITCGEKVDCCSATFLKTYFGDEAENAAKVCEKASQGSPFASTLDEGRDENSCFKGGNELGIGLFLINIYKTNLAPGALSESDGKCIVTNQDILNDIGGKLLDPVINAQTAAQLYKNNVAKDNCGWEWSSVAKELRICEKETAKSIPAGGGGIVTGDETGGKGTEKPEKVSLGIAELIANFYKWVLGIGGLIALGVLIFGGILYTISAGNASRQGDAKQWLSGALIGILLLFGSYLVLNTINPELTKLKDLELIVNEAAQNIDGNNDFTVQGTACGGFYKSNVAQLVNYGDPECAYVNNKTQFLIDLQKYLIEVDRGNARHWYFDVIPEETIPEYNPNSRNLNSTCTKGNNPSCEWGACGLFQMDCECKQAPDCGAAHWRDQVTNAVALIRAGRYSYWPCDWYRIHDGSYHDGVKCD